MRVAFLRLFLVPGVPREQHREFEPWHHGPSPRLLTCQTRGPPSTPPPVPFRFSGVLFCLPGASLCGYCECSRPGAVEHPRPLPRACGPSFLSHSDLAGKRPASLFQRPRSHGGECLVSAYCTQVGSGWLGHGPCCSTPERGGRGLEVTARVQGPTAGLAAGLGFEP